MKETKNKYAIYLYPSLVEEIDTLMKDAISAVGKGYYVQSLTAC